MNTRIRHSVIALVIISVLGWLGWSIAQYFEYVDEVDWQPLQGEARSNPLYASRLFLKRMGIPTTSIESLQSLTTLPDTNTVIIITSARHTLRHEQVADLLQWVHQGGHLIIRSVTANWEYFTPKREQPLVDDNHNDSTDNPDDRQTFSDDAFQHYLQVYTGESIPFERKPSLPIQLPNAEHPLHIGSDYYEALVLDAESEQQGLHKVLLNGQNFILQQQVSDGLITLASDLSIIDNYSLDNFDHAEILWHLVHSHTKLTPHPSAVWLVHSDDIPSLFQLIWQKFWPLVIMLGLLLLIWVWRASRRFGPMIPKAAESRRNLMEHIHASGHYYWQQHQHSILLDSTRAATQQRLIQRIPGWQAMSYEQQANVLATRTSLSEAQILTLLHKRIARRPHDFTETIKQLEYIRTTV